MSSAPALRRFGRSEWLPLLLIVVVVLLANGSYVLGIRSNDPLGARATIGATSVGPVQGRTTIDRNDGYTSQALGTLAAKDLVHGHLPLWNEYEGVGMPLAGEMQSAALFPFTVIQVLSNGIFWEHLLLQILGGVATYLFLRRLKIGRLGAFAGGAVFALVATSPWLTNAAFNPIALLPVALLGVEMIAQAAAARRSSAGWIVFGLGIGLSLLSGFPETAYIDGLVVFAYAVLRLVQLRGVRKRFAAGIAGGGVAGLALAAPAMVAFAAYLGFADTGTHGGGCSSAAMPSGSLPGLVLPYVYGPIFGQSDPNAAGFLHSFWGNVGGYVTVAILAMALAGLVARRQRAAVLLFAGAGVVMLGRIYGPHVAVEVFNLIPGMKQVCAYRYAPPALIMSVVVLMAFGVDSVGERAPKWRWPAVLGIGAAVLLMAALVAQGHLNDATVPHRYRWAVGSIVWGAACLSTVAIGVLLAARGRVAWGRRIVAGVLVFDAAAMFVIPQASAGHKVDVDTPAISYLQAHLGLHRVLTLGVLAPNYGSYFRIAQINVNDLPFPKLFAQYATTDLYPNSLSDVFFPGKAAPHKPAPGPIEEALVEHLDAFREAGVAYVMTSRSHISADQARRAHLRRVYTDDLVRIWAVPDPKPYFDTTAPCTTVANGRYSVTVTCTQPTQLIRREMYAPGWTAEVNGHSADVSAYAPPGSTVGLFQTIPLPAGTSTVTFSYRPRGFDAALAAAGVGAVSMLVGIGWAIRRRRPKIEESVTSL